MEKTYYANLLKQSAKRFLEAQSLSTDMYSHLPLHYIQVHLFSTNVEAEQFQHFCYCWEFYYINSLAPASRRSRYNSNT